MADFAINSRRFKAIYGLWLGIALLLHLALLLVPIGMPRELSPAPEAITVILAIQSKASSPVEQPVNHQPELDQETKPQSGPPAPQDTQRLVPAPLSAQDLPKAITAAQLFHNVSYLKWPLPESEKPLKLGAFKPQLLPVNWLPSLKMGDNLFSGKVVSARTEIVDQWLAADGGYNVVVNTPTGQTLCGRAQAWNPMNPLEEHVTLWRLC